MKRINIDPAAPYAGLAFALFGAMIFGIGVGTMAPIPMIVGLLMMGLGTFILVGLVSERKEGTHRRE